MAKIELEIDEKGGLVHNGVPCEMYRRGAVSALQKEFMSQLGKGTKMVFYIVFKERMKAAMAEKFRTFRNLLGPLVKKQMIDLLLEELPRSGFGAGKAAELDEENATVRVIVRNSANALAFVEKVDKPVCYALAGKLAGGVELIFDRPMICKEVKCTATGDPFCEFVLKPAKKK